MYKDEPTDCASEPATKPTNSVLIEAERLERLSEESTKLVEQLQHTFSSVLLDRVTNNGGCAPEIYSTEEKKKAESSSYLRTSLMKSINIIESNFCAIRTIAGLADL
jgi:hypothetical protein